jgi:hypothetical protein
MSKQNVAEPMEKTKTQIDQESKTKNNVKSDKSIEKESSFTLENAVMVTGITLTAVAAGAVVFYYATAGLPLSVGIILVLIDGVTVALMGAVGTALGVYGVRILKDIFRSKPKLATA